MIFITYMALQHGQPDRLLFGVDSFGNVCGKKNDVIEDISLSGIDMTSKPFIFSFSPVKQAIDAIPSIKICVERCPNETLVTPSQYAEYELCLYNIYPEFYTVLTLASDSCPSPPVQPSFSLLNRCVPTALSNVATTFINTDWMHTALADIKTSWREIAILCLIAVALSSIILVFIRFFAGLVIWIMVTIFAAGSLGGTGYLWYRWYSRTKLMQEIPEEDHRQTDHDNIQAFLIYACVASVVTVILLLILLFLAKRLALVAALFREAGKVVAAIPFLLLQPFWTFFGILLVIGGCGYILLYLITVGKPTSQDDGTVKFVEDEFLYYMRFYFIFGMIWGTQFLVAMEQCITAGAVADWFFSRDKSHLGTPIISSIKRTFRYHLGSIAFGSLIIALVMAARIILGYIQSRLQHTQNQLAQYLLKCLSCFLWLFEKVLRYINRNAYIEIAIYGHNFCKSAQRAFTVIVSNAVRVAVINSVGDFLLFLSKMSVTAGVVVIGIELFQRNTDVNFYAVPVGLAAIFAFAVSHIFLSVYEMVIDTLFLCFCEDCEMNDGLSKPYFMSRNLMSFVENATRAKHIDEVKKAVKERGQKMNTV